MADLGCKAALFAALLALGLFLAGLSARPALASTIPDSAATYNGHYYQAYLNDCSWETAQKRCAVQGGHLVTITKAAERSFIDNYLAECFDTDLCNTPLWIGAYSGGNKDWKWITQEAMSYTRWSSNDTGQRYAATYQCTWWARNTTAEYSGCDCVQGYICEWDGKWSTDALEVTPVAYSDNTVSACVTSKYLSTYKGTKATLTVGSKSYSATVGKTGKITFKGVALAKIGATVKVVIESGKNRSTISNKVVCDYPTKVTCTRLYANGATCRVTVTGGHKDDTIKLKVGSKSYTKTLAKSRIDEQNFVFLLSAKKVTMGSKVTCTVTNAAKQKVATSRTSKVYYSAVLIPGMTKTQVKNTVGYGTPDKDNTYVLLPEEWIYYYDDGRVKAKLYFVNNKLTVWTVE